MSASPAQSPAERRAHHDCRRATTRGAAPAAARTPSPGSGCGARQRSAPGGRRRRSRDGAAATSRASGRRRCGCEPQKDRHSIVTILPEIPHVSRRHVFRAGAHDERDLGRPPLVRARDHPRGGYLEDRLVTLGGYKPRPPLAGSAWRQARPLPCPCTTRPGWCTSRSARPGGATPTPTARRTRTTAPPSVPAASSARVQTACSGRPLLGRQGGGASP